MTDVAKKSNKAIIRIEDKYYKAKDKDIPLQYNPEKYSIGKTVVWTDQHRKGTPPELQFSKQNHKTLSFDLFFDTYEQGLDVRTTYTSKIVALTEPFVKCEEEKSRPPICLFSWGKLTFRGVVENVTQNFTLFTRDGIPVRARLTVRMKQFSTAKEKTKDQPPGDPEKVRIVKEGDRLYTISTEEYGTPDQWRLIAEANHIENPRFLQPGQTLLIPVLE
ncbi:MAG: LysM peptidoglycan-binding domain-containing protein [bacterium]|nr:LysM peptidoglycan-binding domain-containing protein [bacterium]